MNVSDPIKAGQLTIRYLVDGSAAKSLGIFELEVPPGSNVPPPHSHSDNEEIVYVLEGRLRTKRRSCLSWAVMGSSPPHRLPPEVIAAL